MELSAASLEVTSKRGTLMELDGHVWFAPRLVTSCAESFKNMTKLKCGCCDSFCSRP